MFNGIFATPFIIPVVAILAWAYLKALKIKHGIPDHEQEWDGDPQNLNTPPMFKKMMDKAMAERDAEILDLKQRIIVLEKIITETHKSHSLAEEIEKLRDHKG